jgi:hypothetical protein
VGIPEATIRAGTFARGFGDAMKTASPWRDAKVARQQLGLKHLEMNNAIFDVATCEAGASDTLELCPMFVEIAEGLVLRPKRRLETANLPN